MKTYEITIQPKSGFGTPLKGDTIFGHLCWQAAYDQTLFGASLADLLAIYAESPFLVVSSAYPKLRDANDIRYAMQRPTLPMSMLFDAAALESDRKKLKACSWMLLDKGERIGSFRSAEYVDEQTLLEKIGKNASRLVEIFDQPRNAINRLTGTTGAAPFAPFAVEQSVYLPDLELAIFVVADGSISLGNIKSAFERIGAIGFGKDASVGLGRFVVTEATEFDLSALGSETPNACYTLSPCVPQKGAWVNSFFCPFTRFGRHGDAFAKSGKPFKNPVVMADDGAVFVPYDSEKIFTRPYFGSAVTGVSKAEPETVVQGYAPYIPVKIGGE